MSENRRFSRPFLRAVVVFAAALTLVTPLRAADWLLATAEPRVAVGRPFEVALVAATDAVPEGGWPQRVVAHIELPGGGPRVQIELVRIGPVGGGGEDGERRSAGNAVGRYLGEWPAEVVDVVALSLPDFPGARLLLDARPAMVQLADAAADAAEVGEAEVGTGEAGMGVSVAMAVDAGEGAPEAAAGGLAPAQERGLAPLAEVATLPPGRDVVAPFGLGFHEPMYFLVGGKNPVSARFQFSFKYRIFDDRGVVAESVPFARGLYFGFTQTSLWDLQSDSKPFRDSSFRPTLFYAWNLFDPADRGSLALSMGYEHESNGKDDSPSRSIDTVFARADLRYFLNGGPVYVGVAPKIWHYLDREDNPDIARYRGYGELGLRIGRDDGLMLNALVRRGTANKMGTQLDLSYPLRTSVFSGVGAFIHLQAYKGYGETLLDYDVRREPQYRIGISLVR
ncbi:MAG: phospholipase A [Rhodocyclaceae bacterium]